MRIRKRNCLPDEEMKQVLNLLETCHAYDGTASIPYLANDYNVDPDMPCIFLAYEEETLLGCLYVYADEIEDVSVSLFVLPSARNQGIARALEAAFIQVAKEYQLSGISYETERIFIEKNPWLLSHFNLVEEDDAELWLRRERKPYDLESRDDCKVVLAEKEMIGAIAKVQAEAFQKSIDNSEQYAHASLEGDDTLLYVLMKDKEVLASVTIDTTSDYNHIFGLGVAPVHQGQGLGSYLMKEVICQLLSRNDKAFQIVVEKENIVAATLYRKLGFTDVTEVVYLAAKN
ncbi:GNAT family N-acetyltransferase [Streptococcus sp. zg-86]|uniref:GNAT family N-acetyltransferase n=1 Tax=Streptococcus zhangguiae TaxID=2664091 RepID=A0A6I4R9W8_9STRE|nr:MULTISPECIES: GNAT family N-acetyltransferase [unclassified Streptococcus]MTB64671.1 GNAT family N-acetyltransferase [Streptococcus sp. zg-86]MTB90981.1 GNAT family N-acetyltransferase [Streptococcus sp. zg-36]MWV56596.1 GNAT family N-acetyltransferase [Streptococcus sp. zg-70]QTH48556.1 GNAT family N-acetyltransferase [Streptococcus sp. zg-86]